MKLANRLALITGGGRGIGRAIAFAFAREGAPVAVAARTLKQIRSVANEISQEFRVEALPLKCDVGNAGSVVDAFDEFRTHFGRGPDIVVNNAGVVKTSLFVNTDEEIWVYHLNTNLGGTFRCTHAALPEMIERGWGRIINIASIAGKTGAPYIAPYAASKHGVLGLTRSLALEVAAQGITVNAICPGYVDTDMTSRGIENIVAKTGKSAKQALKMLEQMSPQNRLVTPEEVAALAVLLASDEGRGINGQAINVDGGTVLF
ncbi:MAG TPA: 3-oxoacyl-ACP reductase FabG [Pyrinomonadaceae bacterium]|jgi:NAD(P)-dependent dehydrogenase (short-subunit alcohol dehydrogenase family)|nr:3-oxoacyl-ACP reductase FabG [Pyrinomonadaceae bacterium]